MHRKPALKVLAFFILGILIGRYFDFSVPLIYGFSFFSSLVALLLLLVHWGSKQVRTAFLLLSLLGIAFVRYEFSTGYFSAGHVSNFTNRIKPITLTGVVVNYPERRVNKTNLTVRVERVFDEQESILPVDGKILVSVLNQIETVAYGDEVLVSGRLRKPRDRRNPGEFDYREYLLAQGIFAVMTVSKESQIQKLSSEHGSWLFRNLVCPVKLYLDEFIQENVPAKESALLHGLLIGERGEIPLELKEAFSKLGVIHILAVSGLHVGFVILIFMGIFGAFRVPYSKRVLLTILGLIFYAYLTNLKPPVVRASTMGGLILLGTVLERKTDIYNTLALAALIILILNPLELFQPGFQLSFTAVTAIIYLYPKIKALPFFKKICLKFQTRNFIRYPLELLFVSTAAFLGTLPFTILYFNRMPSYSLIANLFVIPLAFCGLASGIAAAIVNLFLPIAANFYLDSAWFFLRSIIALVEWGSQLPFAYWEIYTFSSLQALAYFAGLLFLFNINHPRVKRWLLIYVLFIMNFWLWQSILKNSHEMEVVFLDVGQGDAALLTFPNGKHVLIDGGKRNPYFDNGKSVIAPYLRRAGIHEIDVLILSHADSDHIGGFPYILRNFKVKEVWDNGQTKDTRVYREYRSLIDSLQIRHRTLRAGDIVENFDPVIAFVVHPTETFAKNVKYSANDASLSLKFSFGETDLLFLGDIEMNGESSVNKFGELLASEVLKVSHHGSNTSSSQKFIDYVKPELAVISVGEFNPFGHPKKEALHRIGSSGAKILRTDRDAAVILRTDGRKVKRVNWKW